MARALGQLRSSWKGLLNTLQAGSTHQESTMFAPTAIIASIRPFASTGATRGRPRKATTAQAGKAGGATAAVEKKPPSAYAIYMKAAYPQTKDKLGQQADFTTVSKHVSSQWNSMSDSEKGKYIKESQHLRAEWEQKQPAKPPKPAPVRKVKAKGPKKPPTAYAAFVQRNFQVYRKPGASAPDTMKVLAGQWKQLTESEKAQYKGKTATAAS